MMEGRRDLGWLAALAENCGNQECAMSRHGYSEDCDDDAAQWSYIRHRGAVTSAFRGKKGQAFFREMLAALDALPEKKLIAGSLVDGDGCACALGAVAKARGLDVSEFVPGDDYDPEAHEGDGFGWLLNIADAMGREVMWYNDEGPFNETPEARWIRMRRWTERQLIEWDAA
jgi:hypothetical protein